MLIRKLFKFENAHVVRNCSSDRCKFSIHGHSYKVEVLLEGSILDNGQMLYDFGLLKSYVRDIIDSFDHATTFWCKDDPEYIKMVMKHSARWVMLPVSPSAEQFSRVIFFLVNQILASTVTANGEGSLIVNSVIVHETDTGYAQAFAADVSNPQMGLLTLEEICFSDAVQAEWSNKQMYQDLLKGNKFVNHRVLQQVVA